MLAVLVGGRAEPASDRPVQRLGTSQADVGRDGGDGEIRCLEQPSCGLDAQRFDVRRRGGPGLGPPRPHEGPLAHGGTPGQRCDAQVLAQVVGHPALELTELLPAGGSCLELRRELRLPAGATHEHHQPRGDGMGQVGPVIVLDEREGEVDTCGDAGRGPAIAVPDVDPVAVHLDVGVLSGELLARRPVRRRPVPVVLPGASVIEVHGEFNEDWLRTLRIRRVLTADGTVLFDVEEGHEDPQVETAIDEVNTEYLDLLLDLTGDTYMGASAIRLG